MYLTLGAGREVRGKSGGQLSNDMPASQQAEADERGSEQHHGRGLRNFGNVRRYVRLVGIDSAVRANAFRDAEVLDDGDTVALPGVNGVQKGKLERQARVCRGSEVGGREVGCGHHVKRRGVYKTAAGTIIGHGERSSVTGAERPAQDEIACRGV